MAKVHLVLETYYEYDDHDYYATDACTVEGVYAEDAEVAAREHARRLNREHVATVFREGILAWHREPAVDRLMVPEGADVDDDAALATLYRLLVAGAAADIAEMRRALKKVDHVDEDRIRAWTGEERDWLGEMLWIESAYVQTYDVLTAAKREVLP